MVVKLVKGGFVVNKATQSCSFSSYVTKFVCHVNVPNNDYLLLN